MLHIIEAEHSSGAVQTRLSGVFVDGLVSLVKSLHPEFGSDDFHVTKEWISEKSDTCRVSLLELLKKYKDHTEPCAIFGPLYHQVKFYHKTFQHFSWLMNELPPDCFPPAGPHTLALANYLAWRMNLLEEKMTHWIPALEYQKEEGLRSAIVRQLPVAVQPETTGRRSQVMPDHATSIAVIYGLMEQLPGFGGLTNIKVCDFIEKGTFCSRTYIEDNVKALRSGVDGDLRKNPAVKHIEEVRSSLRHINQKKC